MNRLLAVACGFLWTVNQALGAPPADQRPAHAPSPKRALAACMSRQMSANRALSYNGATTLCKAQLKAATPAMAAAGGGTAANGRSAKGLNGL